jgi:hypothetical protein
MTIQRGRFYFGSAGDMLPLPMTIGGGTVDTSPVRYAAFNRALRGTPSVTIYGVRRSWPLAWPTYIRADSEEYRSLQRVEAVYRGLVRRRAYFLDTRRVNVLSPDVSTCGGELGGENFAVTSGTLNRVNIGPMHSDLYALGEGWLEWGGIATGAGKAVHCLPHTPVIDGSSYTWTFYLNTDGSGSVAPYFQFYDRDRGTLASVADTAITLTTTPTRYTMTLAAADVPADAATFQLGLNTQTTTTDLSTAGWQLEIDMTSPSVWTLGAGGAEVLVDSWGEGYVDAARLALTAEFLEV